jgi:DNA-directed RNA polymerase subunit K/omega
MSDDEGGEDYGDYEDIGVDDGEPEPGRDAEPEPEDGETGLEEDAAGTDEEEDEEEGDDGAADEDGEFAETSGASQKAHPQRQRVDPILRVSNKPRTVTIVPPEERVTDNRLHKNEAAYVISMRAEQIAKFATHFTEASTLHDPVAIAFKELYDRRCPLMLRRSVGTGPLGEDVVEEWSVRDMALPPLTPPAPLGGGAPPRRGGTA